MAPPRPETADGARRFVEHFAAGWQAPADADVLADHFDAWLDPDFKLSQPLWKVTATGPEAFREGFAKPVLAVLSNIRGTVEACSAEGNQVFIAVRLDATIGRRPVTLRVVDRITLLDGRAVERHSYADVLPLVAAVMRSPSVWWRVVVWYRTILRANRKAAARTAG